MLGIRDLSLVLKMVQADTHLGNDVAHDRAGVDFGDGTSSRFQIEPLQSS